MVKKSTNKQILDAYGQSYNLMQEAKRHDDMLRKLEEKVGGKIIHISHKQDYENSK